MATYFGCDKHSQWIINGDIWIDGKRIASAPKSKSGKTSSTVINDKIYVNGYEYKNGEWKRTLAALWHLWFQEVKDMENTITKIEKLDPHPTEAIVVSWNFNDIDLDNMKNLFNVIQSKFPDNTVVAIPDYISLQSCSKDVLENIISMIAEIIEEL